jgi:hypothetical protein
LIHGSRFDGKRIHTMNKSVKVELIIDNYIQLLEGLLIAG